MTWITQLPPSEQITIVVMVVTSVFNAGVFYATIRFLAKRVRGVEEHQTVQDSKIEDHGQKIAALEERTHRRVGA